MEDDNKCIDWTSIGLCIVIPVCILIHNLFEDYEETQCKSYYANSEKSNEQIKNICNL